MAFLIAKKIMVVWFGIRMAFFMVAKKIWYGNRTVLFLNTKIMVVGGGGNDPPPLLFVMAVAMAEMEAGVAAHRFEPLLRRLPSQQSSRPDTAVTIN